MSTTSAKKRAVKVKQPKKLLKVKKAAVTSVVAKKTRVARTGKRPAQRKTVKKSRTAKATSKSKLAAQRLRLIGVIVLLIGVAGLVPPLYYRYRDQQLRAQAAFIPDTPQFQLPDRPNVISGKPKLLEVPSLNMRLAIIDGAYDNNTGQWTLSLDKVHYALPTVLPNNYEGNTLIYGHYRPEVFARLHKVTKGSEAVVTTENGYKFYYTFRDSQATSPSDTSIFAYRGAPLLTLQTCSGAYMQNRQLFSFDFNRYEKI